MRYYEATQKCYVLGVLLEPNSIIGLNEEQERELKVGKFVEEVPDQKALRRDPKSNKKLKIGNAHLAPVKKSVADKLEGREFEEGFVVFPPAFALMSKNGGIPRGDGAHTTVGTVSPAGIH